ncbi:MAG: AAA family ATPase [Candidatus Lokiarchaeota archaeon]|nr:AAA family ATPase [Candidatus Harpocratesius repetitus]
MVEKELNEIRTLIRAGATVIQVVSYEQQRVQGFVDAIAKELGLNWFDWNYVKGLQKSNDGVLEAFKHNLTDPIDLLEEILTDESENGLYICHDFHPFMNDNPKIIRLLREIITTPFEHKKALILCQPIKIIPNELLKEMPIVEVELPSSEILEVIADVVKEKFNLDNQSFDKSEGLINAALGLTTMEAQLAFSKAIVETNQLNEESINYIIKEKENIIKKKGTLEYFHPNDDFESIGGLNVLKEWLRKRGKAFKKGAQEYGLDKPRGVLLLGIPGCGKSLSAKAIANVWNFPLLRFDLGKVFSGIVGESEQNIRNALDIAKALAPCVLWIDEIEKGLSGVKSSNETDSGVSARIFGTFLTWMQEKKEPVFVVATANDISQLPPELLRKGRFDEIFFVDLPTLSEREEIFRIHIKKKKRNPENFNIQYFAKITVGFTGSEIEEIVKEALFRGFDENRQIQDKDFIGAIKDTIPLSVTMGTDLGDLRKWAKYHAKLASKDEFNEDLSEITPKEDIPKLKQASINPFIKRNETK